VPLFRSLRREYSQHVALLPPGEVVNDDRDEIIVKAQSWALRTLVARDSDADGWFLKEKKFGYPALVLRDVQNKLAPGRMSPRSSHGKAPAKPAQRYYWRCYGDDRKCIDKSADRLLIAAIMPEGH